MGRQEEYGSFLRFISKVLESEVDCEGLSVRYHSPKNGVMSFGWEGALKVEGKEIAIDHYKRFDNPFCQSEYLSGKYVITYGGETLTIEM